ncbi:hypothetical protein C8Q80DRAFT_273189 [Daedaleopsis nitida]|nr:hypothetical protein C8Q80DRAFT_273189 [Daedaleopsis nitida]
MFPRQHLPAQLDPLWVDLPLNDIPLCWFGVPFLLSKVIDYAKEYGFDCPATAPFLACVPRAVDPGKSWHNICKYFYQQTGINLRIREVWDRQLPILVFWTNRELVYIKDANFQQVRMLLTDMGYREDYPMRWYLDRLEEP